MVVRCTFELPDGRLCGAWPLKGEERCFWHAPGKAEEAAEARRLGGLRRRREKTLQGAYDLEGLASLEAIRRILEIATCDVLGLDNSVARARVLIAAALAALRLFEVGELQARVGAIEVALHQTGAAPEATADAELLRLLRRAS